MKKRLICLVLVVLFCLSFNATASAATDVGVITPRGAVNLTSDLTLVSGSTYRAWASATAFAPEDITVGFTLYKFYIASYVYVTSARASGYGTYFIAQKTLSLSPGVYKLYAWYVGETQNDAQIKYYYVP